MTIANKVRVPETKVPKQAPNKNSGFFSEVKHAVSNWLRTLSMSDKAPSNMPEKILKFGGTFRIDDGIQELVLADGYTLLAFESTSGLQLSIVNAAHHTVQMSFKETIYSLPPLHIYNLDDGGTREVCGDIQKISTADGHMIVLDSRGIVLVAKGAETEQFRRSYATSRATNRAECMNDQRAAQRSES